MEEIKLSKSEQFKDEYSAVIVTIGKITAVPNSDFLGFTTVSGFDIVIRKDEVKEGDTMIYCPIETKLNSKFLSCNNLYSNSSLNDLNISGYFGEKGRVRIIKLRGLPSMGVLFSLSNIEKWANGKLTNYTIGESFDTVNDSLFIEVYIPSKCSHKTCSKVTNINTGFNYLIKENFPEHYDTLQLNKYAHLITPSSLISITEKLDGTSFRIANILGNKKLNIFQKIGKFLGFNIESTEYRVFYASRRKVLNAYYRKSYADNIYSHAAKLLQDYIPEDCILYAELIGWNPVNGTAITRKGKHLYNYGCVPNEFKIVPYRINIKGNERSVQEVIETTNHLVLAHPELRDIVVPMKLMYHGLARDVFSDIVEDANWSNKFLENLKKPSKRFLMEQTEPTCSDGTPSEGIVLRIDTLKLSAFKLKSVAYYNIEAKNIDKGILDEESIINYEN